MTDNSNFNEITFGDLHLKIVERTIRWRTREEARDVCLEHGAVLPEFYGDVMFDAILNFLRSYYFPQDPSEHDVSFWTVSLYLVSSLKFFR